MTKIVKAGVLVLLLCLCGAAALAQTPPGVIGVDTILRQESDLSQLPILRNWTSHLQSSYDRTGGNGDSGHYLALNGDTATIADMDGPGAVIRFWSAGSTAHIKIYIDNNPTPVVDTGFGNILDGSTPPFVSPIAQNSSGGSYSYLPIPYAKHCRITLDQPGGLYYHVNYVTFAPGTAVRSFALPLTPTDQAALQSAVNAWKTTGTALQPLPAGAHSRTVTVAAGQTRLVSSEKGPGTISRLQFQAPDVDDLGLRRLVLRGYFDGHQTPDLEAPIADFFGNAYGRKPFTSLLLSQNENGLMEARFPMPFGRSARFTLENGTGKPVRVIWNVAMVRQPFRPAQEGYFHAQWSQELARKNLPHVWAKVRGQRGKFVGVVQTMAGMENYYFLEGDDQFRVDAQTWGASQVASTVIGPWNGTGTEDFFNSAWYFGGGPNSLPVNGLLVKDHLGHMGRINAYRWLLVDAPVFQQSLDAQIEHEAVNDRDNNYYSSVAYWYADGPTQPWSITPAASAIQSPFQPGANLTPILTLTNPIEGESLAATAQATGGKAYEQYMGDYPSSWSNDHQLTWSEGKVGDTLTLTLPAHPGVFDLVGYFTQAGDYGQVRFSLNGQPVGGVYDGYHTGVVNSGPVSLGRVTLPAGPSRFVVTITGRNAASANTLFGLDALVLTPPAK